MSPDPLGDPARGRGRRPLRRAGSTSIAAPPDTGRGAQGVVAPSFRLTAKETTMSDAAEPSSPNLESVSACARHTPSRSSAAGTSPMTPT